MSTPTGFTATKKQRDAVIQMMRLNAGELEPELKAGHQEELLELERHLASEDPEVRLMANAGIAAIEHEYDPATHAKRVRDAFEQAVAEGAYSGWSDEDWIRIGIDPPKRAAQAKKVGKQDVADWILQQPDGTTFTHETIKKKFGITPNTLRKAIEIASAQRQIEDDGKRPATFTIL